MVATPCCDVSAHLHKTDAIAPLNCEPRKERLRQAVPLTPRSAGVEIQTSSSLCFALLPVVPVKGTSIYAVS